MPSATVAGGELRERLADFDDAVLDAARRADALERFFTQPSGREKAGRYWRVDLESIAPEGAVGGAGVLTVVNPHSRAVACDLETAAREYPALFARAFGKTSAQSTKFGALATAFARLGAFVYVPADLACDDPIELTYAIAPGVNVFPYTVVLAERGARATIVERLTGGEGAFVCAVAEIVTAENADVTYAASQQLAGDARVLATRAALPGRDARVAWADAELGASLAVVDLSVSMEEPGVRAQITALFFPRDSQHVDAISTVEHRVGATTSETLVKSAATQRGQARYVGNIRIAPHAQGSDASLRDDALLLSDKAHIDSVPALEIGANDVKAYHGATVGALDDDAIFYMQSRGIDRNAAERMIALGFFEPAIDRFTSPALRGELRAAIEAKLA